MDQMLPLFFECYTLPPLLSHRTSQRSTICLFSAHTGCQFPTFHTKCEYHCHCYLPAGGNFTHPRWILVLGSTFHKHVTDGQMGKKSSFPVTLPLCPRQSYSQLGNKCCPSLHCLLMKGNWGLESVFKPSSLWSTCSHLPNLPSLTSSEEKDAIYCQVDCRIWCCSLLIPTDFPPYVPGNWAESVSPSPLPEHPGSIPSSLHKRSRNVKDMSFDLTYKLIS